MQYGAVQCSASGLLVVKAMLPVLCQSWRELGGASISHVQHRRVLQPLHSHACLHIARHTTTAKTAACRYTARRLCSASWGYITADATATATAVMHHCCPPVPLPLTCAA